MNGKNGAVKSPLAPNQPVSPPLPTLQQLGERGVQPVSLFGNRTVGQILFGGGEFAGEEPIAGILDLNTVYRVAAFLFGAIMVFIAISRLLQQPVKQATQFIQPAAQVVKKAEKAARR